MSLVRRSTLALAQSGLLSMSLVSCSAMSTAVAGAPEQTWSFDQTSTLPDGWSLGETHGAGAPATWETLARGDAPSAPSVFGVTATDNHGNTFNVALADSARFGDLDLSVAVRASSGTEDQGGGPVWRALDTSNYYVVRWNPLEENFRVYVVEHGHRKQLDSAPATGDTTGWHTIRVVAVGDHIDCYLDGELLLSVDDETFASPGRVGLWTKADAATLFDDLHVKPAAP